MRPSKQYKLMLQSSELHYDATQEAVVGHLDLLYSKIMERKSHPSLFQRLFRPHRTKGLYLWGGVGCGKTHLMDMFYGSIKKRRRLRLHFHRFMQKIHESLMRYEGYKNPLKKVAAEIALESEIICFDDFFVEEIGDAMILSKLFRELLSRGVLLVVTSNIAPDKLYENGLQRGLFLPAIALIKKHCKILEMTAGQDYRLLTLKKNKLYHCPANKLSEKHMDHEFDLLAPEKGNRGQIIEVEGRELWTRRMADDVVWFNFADLCEGPRSQSDYLHLALEFHAILLSNVPQMNASQDAAARRFIYLIDVLYDHRVKMVISADATPHELYTGTQLRNIFIRASSRLIEMQSVEYLSCKHRSHIDTDT